MTIKSSQNSGGYLDVLVRVRVKVPEAGSVHGAGLAAHPQVLRGQRGGMAKKASITYSYLPHTKRPRRERKKKG